MRKVLLVSAFLAALSSSALAQTTSGATSSVSINNPAPTDTKARVITAPPIAAPGLAAAGVETCLGSATGGLSIMGGGITFGRTYPDEGCNIRLAARQLFAFGFQKAAMALMCQDAHVAEAMQAAGQPCSTIIADTKPRRRAAAEDNHTITTGSVNQTSNNTRTLPEKTSGRGRKTETGITSTATTTTTKIVPWKNPDDIDPVETPESTQIAANADEERWFARMTSTY